MSMNLKSNMGAVRTLGTLNKNTAALTKDLQKVASGMKINGAGDDASGYSISEGMRAQLRSLQQDISNAQNGTAMLRVADGGVTSTINILKELKERAINAANDTNTDIDRATIQKEINQAVEQIDRNAYVEFNGMPLLDGSAEVPAQTVEELIVDALHSEWLENAMEQIEYGYGLNFREDDTSCRDIDVEFINSDDTADTGDDSALAWVTNHPDSEGRCSRLTLTVNMKYYASMDKYDYNGKSADTSAFLDRTITHEMTHAVMASNITNFNSLPLFVIEGSAELIHGIDDERRGLIAAMGTPPGTALSAALAGTGSTAGEEPYAAGYMFLRYMAKKAPGEPRDALQRFMHSLNESKLTGMDAIDAAITVATKDRFTSKDALVAAMVAECASSSSADEFLKNACDIDLRNEDTGNLMGWDASGTERLDAVKTVTEAGSVKYWKPPLSKTSLIEGLTVHWPEGLTGQIGTKVLQTGTKANQSIKLSALDMRAEAIGVRDDKGNAVSVATRYDCMRAITRFDKALRKALDASTTLGSIINRLSYTASNLVIASENTQSSESNIRDADMAKAMMDYTKHNTLSQAAQSMLSHANQMASDQLKTVTGDTGQSVGYVNKQSATKAQHNLRENDSKLGQQLKQIASGVKLNSAGDGASEFAISKRMEAQIRGLGQDQENVKKGQDFCKLALGGLENTKDCVSRLKELALEAANDTMTDIDRSIAQKEVDQLIQQIDDIAVDTEYMGIKPLMALKGDPTYELTTKAADIVLVIDTTGSMGGMISSAAAGITDFAHYLESEGFDWRIGIVSYGDVFPREGGDPVTKASIDGAEFSSDPAAVSAAISSVPRTGGGDGPESGLEGLMDPDTGAMSYTYRPDAVKTAVLITDAPSHTTADGKSVYSASDVASTFSAKGILISVIGPTRPEYTTITSGTRGSILSGDVGTSLISYADVLLREASVEGTPDERLYIQSGTKSNQGIILHKTDARASTLGLSNLSIRNRDLAVASLDTIDNALEQVTSYATQWGSYVQRLEASYENITTEKEAELAALSQLRDTDIAKAMTEYMKYNVLTQSAQAMLAQANQSREIALSLLK